MNIFLFFWLGFFLLRFGFYFLGCFDVLMITYLCPALGNFFFLGVV